MPEKTTITIEIKKEVSILILWLAGGVSFVTIAFFIPAQTNELWSQFYAAGIATVIYLIALLIYILRKSISMKIKIITACFSILALGSAVAASIEADIQSHWQQNRLLEVRGIIGRGEMLNKLSTPLLETLKQYYQNNSSGEKTLSQVFQNLHSGVVVGSNINKPQFDGDTTKVIVHTLERDRIILVSQETFIHGRNPDFLNLNGQKGMIQEKCTLTEKGVKYESEN
jgi:hypothetical protein